MSGGDESGDHEQRKQMDEGTKQAAVWKGLEIAEWTVSMRSCHRRSAVPLSLLAVASHTSSLKLIQNKFVSVCFSASCCGEKSMS